MRAEVLFCRVHWFPFLGSSAKFLGAMHWQHMLGIEGEMYLRGGAYIAIVIKFSRFKTG